MIVAGLQTDIAWEDPSENFARAERLAVPAAAAGARLLMLPEMFATGFSMNAPSVTAHASEVRAFLADLARRHSVWVLAGVAEAEEPLPCNAALLHDPAGKLAARYRKIHPFALAGEDQHYAAGAEIVTHEIEGVRITPLVCYDLRFPEIFRTAASSTDLFCVMANWPTPRGDAWQTLLSARAIENQAFVLGVNRVGNDPNGNDYRGDSALLDPLGHALATAAEQPALVLGEVDHAAVRRSRSTLGFLSDSRFDLYETLYTRRARRPLAD